MKSLSPEVECVSGKIPQIQLPSDVCRPWLEPTWQKRLTDEIVSYFLSEQFFQNFSFIFY